jgi:hypothetical protein
LIALYIQVFSTREDLQSPNTLATEMRDAHPWVNDEEEEWVNMTPPPVTPM